MCIQNPNLNYTINKFLLILTAQYDCLISGHCTERFVREFLVQYVHFSDWSQAAAWNTNTVHKYLVLHYFFPSCRAPFLTDCFKGSDKDLLSNLHYRFLVQSLYLHDSLASHPVPITTSKFNVIERQGKKKPFLNISHWKGRSVLCYQR